MSVSPTTRFCESQVWWVSISRILSVCKYAGMLVYKYKNQEIMKWWMYASMQIFRYASMKVCKYANLHWCKYTSMQVCRYASIQICKYESMNVYMYACMFWTRFEEVLINVWTSQDQIIKKSKINCDKLSISIWQVFNKLWRSNGQVVMKF